MHEPGCKTPYDCPLHCDCCGGSPYILDHTTALFWELAGNIEPMIERLTKKVGRSDGYFFIIDRKVIVLDTFKIPIKWVKKYIRKNYNNYEIISHSSGIITNMKSPASRLKAITVDCGCYDKTNNPRAFGKFPRHADAVYTLATTLNMHWEICEDVTPGLEHVCSYFSSFAKSLL